MRESLVREVIAVFLDEVTGVPFANLPVIFERLGKEEFDEEGKVNLSIDPITVYTDEYGKLPKGFFLSCTSDSVGTSYQMTKPNGVDVEFILKYENGQPIDIQTLTDGDNAVVSLIRIENPENGQILVFDEQENAFVNKTPVSDIVDEFFEDVTSGSGSVGTREIIIPADLMNLGDKLEGVFAGTYSETNDPKQIALIFEKDSIYESGDISQNGGSWEITLRIIKSDVNKIRASSSLRRPDYSDTGFSEISGINFGQNNKLKLQISSDNPGENMAKFGYVKYTKAKSVEELPPDNSVDSPLTPNLAMHLKFDEANGDAVDSVGVNNLTGYNNPASVVGKINQARQFVAENNHYFAKNNPTGVAPGTGDFTISFWIKTPAELQAYGTVLCWGYQSAGVPFLWIYTSGDGVFFQMSDGSGGIKNTGAGGILTPNAWHHITYVVKRNDAVTLYKNNVPIVSSEFGGLFTGNITPTTTQFVIGNYAELVYPIYRLGATLDDLKIWLRALSSDNVTLDYNNGVSGTTV